MTSPVAVGPGDPRAALVLALLREGPWEAVAATSGADPEGPFCAAVAPTRHPLSAPRQAAWSAAAVTGSLSWLLVQTDDPDAVAATLPAPGGVGAARTGWDGARDSLVDARLALGVAREGVARFEQDWVLATAFGSRDRLGPVWRAGVEVAQRSSHLADAVLAFADHRLSVVGAARALQVHPNTVIYRLERWRDLTGWDPRTFPGLAASVACLRAAVA